MTTSPQGLDLYALQTYLSSHVREVTGPIEADLMHGGRSNLTYRITDGTHAWVLRRPPLGGLTPSAHDMGREFRIVDALQDTGVPLARTVALCEDPNIIGAPFSLVSHVDGTVLRTREDLDDLATTDVEECAFALVDVLATLHSIPYQEVGLDGFGRPQGYLGRQVRRWRDQWQRVATRELPDIERLQARLETHVPDESDASIVHGDARIDNAILDPAELGTVRALVDWEMATLGDPLADLGLHLVYRDPAFAPVLGGSAASTDERMPSRDALAERYARARGRDLSQLDFYLALGYFKIAVIAEGIHARHAAGLTVGHGFETVGRAVPQLAAAGLRTLTERSTL
ncbi:phosphotransferase family protein [Streptomyces chartreusis]|uniref:phosphotransferase family protein n=1 Tax=Streptomyces chartreusis TaxID=1969 RepID=UPI002101A20A|nr:phosphotransferase family protein [Streptomyces chartreusis]